MMRTWSGMLGLLVLWLAVARPWPAPDLVITPKMHHLRSGAEREWAEFPAGSEGAALVIAFDARRNAAPQTLRLRHRDVKQSWLVLLNGREIARLPPDEADMRTYWTVPPGTLEDGRNELRVHTTARPSDDVLIGEATLVDRSRAEVLSEATVEVSVREARDPARRERPESRAQAGPGIPSRITIVDKNGTLASTGDLSGPQYAMRPGVVYTSNGSARLTLPAGRYVIHAGRGFEYGIASVEVDLARGSTTSRQLTIRREVDTAGWAAMDTHVHTGTFARHGDASIEERMLTMAGEGVELPVSTEHDQRVPFGAHARAARLTDHFTPLLGSEVTTPSRGHFNVFPLSADGAAIDRRAPDWARLREAIARAAMNSVIVLNHGRDVHGGFRPLDPARHIGVAGEDLEGSPLPANAMEIVNSGAVMTDPLQLPRDWMGMLNRGIVLSPIGASDSHDVSRYIVGQGRTYVRCNDARPGAIDVASAVENVRRGHVMVSYGLLTEIEVNGRGPGDVAQPGNTVDVRIRVQGPDWTRAQRVALYVNGTNVREEPIGDGAAAGVKWEGTWRLPRPPHDVHLVAIAIGPGVIAPYWPTAKPYQPTSIQFTPHVLGVSGAVFLDADGSGGFESAFDYARREVSAGGDMTSLLTRLGGYDRAIAIQAASLLRAQDPGGFEGRIRSMLDEVAASSEVEKGLSAYLDAWRESGARTDRR
ncbi:MAG: CehA/McbA family metallohydrolase [Vicinamibacterales bacterium]